MNLKELADHLQLSCTTVSRALNGYPEVSESTRQRVVRAATKFHYQPSQHARQLATGCTNVIAHVIPRSQRSALGPAFSDFIEGASDASGRLGYDTQLSIVADSDEFEFYQQIVAKKSADGIVVHAPELRDQRIDLLNELKIPYVLHGRTDVEAEHNWLDVNNCEAFVKAIDFLHELGHRRIGLINGPERLHYAAMRRQGFLEGCQQKNLAIESELMFQGPLTEQLGFNSVEQLFEMQSAATAVVVSGIVPAFGALRSVLSRGLNPASDLSIVVFDDQLSHMANSGEPPLFTSLQSSVRKAGERVIEILESRISQPDMPPLGERWEAELVLGGSTGKLTKLTA